MTCRKGILVPFDSTAATEVIKARRTELIQDLSQAEKLLPVEEHFLEEGFYSYVGIPIIVKDEAIGVLNIAAKSARHLLMKTSRPLRNLLHR